MITLILTLLAANAGELAGLSKHALDTAWSHKKADHIAECMSKPACKVSLDEETGDTSIYWFGKAITRSHVYENRTGKLHQVMVLVNDTDCSPFIRMMRESYGKETGTIQDAESSALTWRYVAHGYIYVGAVARYTSSCTMSVSRALDNTHTTKQEGER